MNIPPSILQKIGRNLHLQKNHPIEIIKNKIYDYFGKDYAKYDNFNPYVSVEDNFDKLLIPKDHPARSSSDTYYKDDRTVLRTHTSAHQCMLLSHGITKFLVTGDVYRKDEIDRNHYPVFHQMEGVCIVKDGQDPDWELKNILDGLVNHLFPGCKYRMKPDYFPFTNPSYEIEVEFNGNWLEILGCGIIQPAILENTGFIGRKGWAFGIGLERLAMILFDIPDIRLFWCTDKEFLDQFSMDKNVKFKPYPKLPALTKDISFWINDGDIYLDKNSNQKWTKENDFFEIYREMANDMVERTVLFDSFYHPTKKMYSRSYHIIYSSPSVAMTDPGEFNRMVNELHLKISNKVVEKLSVTIR